MDIALVEVSTACAGSAAVLGLVQALRAGARRHTAWLHALALALTATWMLSACVYLRQPLSQPRAAALLALFVLALGAWPAAAVALDEPSPARLWKRWGPALCVSALASAVCAAVAWTSGVDWLTGIGSEPLIILSRAGMAAMTLAGVPAALALAVLAWQCAPQWARMPRLFLGTAGVVGSQVGLWVCLLVSGYVPAGVITAFVALGAAAALLWMLGVAREVPAAPRVVLSRRLVYAAAIATLALGYALAAGAAVGWMGLFGQASAGAMLPALGFLGAALLLVAWARWRRSLWVGINRHVFGSKYDYGEVWIRLADIVTRARGLADLVPQTAEFCRQLLGAPEVSVWVADSAGNLRLAARALEVESVTEPVEAERCHAAALPSSAREDVVAEVTHATFACPLLVGEHLVGVLAAGSERRPAALDAEDRELLRHVSAQVAGALGIYRLGEELGDARELASFHRLSGFVIHDLKNLAVQQSFVLENAKRHGQDPRFIADALAAFEDSTQRMRALIGKLRPRATTPSPARPVACDLTGVVREILATPGLANAPGSGVRAVLPEGGRPCTVLVDRTALLQALNHLMVNAIESLTHDEGQVTIAVDRIDGSACRIDVSDNGCGMSEEFLREHAFRPFRTTKSSGMGVGLYQCKTIVEAAGGTIAIASSEGQGTTVSITIPSCAEPPALDQVA